MLAVRTLAFAKTANAAGLVVIWHDTRSAKTLRLPGAGWKTMKQVVC